MHGPPGSLPQAARWRARLGRVLKRQGRFAEAEAALREALRQEPDLLDAHLGLAAIYRRKGKWAEEARVYERALRLKPDDARLHADLGLAPEAQGATGHCRERVPVRGGAGARQYGSVRRTRHRDAPARPTR